jgi:DMSO/TMAO reductase YedYZ heme-binding membrane subunit
MSIKLSYSGKIIIVTTTISILYAVLRYNIVGTVPWKDLPILVMNKGIALSALVLLTFNFSLSPLKNIGVHISDKWLNNRKSMGITGFVFAFIHLFMSVSILNPKYYSVFFMDDGTLSLRGGISLFGGILSFVLLWVYNISFKPILKHEKKIKEMISSRRFFVYGMLFTGIHLFFMGYTGWITISKWQGGLPPISLISFVIFAFGYLINLVGREKK